MGLRQRRNTERLHETLHSAGRYPTDIGFGNDLDERPFRPGPSIEEPLRDSPWNESHLIFGRDHWVSDQERVETLARLCADGYSKQVMIAHDHCLKVHFAEHGGKGWAYTLTEVVPMLREAGVTEDQLNDILVENPKRIFAV